MDCAADGSGCWKRSSIGLGNVAREEGGGVAGVSMRLDPSINNS